MLCGHWQLPAQAGQIGNWLSSSVIRPRLRWCPSHHRTLGAQQLKTQKPVADRREVYLKGSWLQCSSRKSLQVTGSFADALTGVLTGRANHWAQISGNIAL